MSRCDRDDNFHMLTQIAVATILGCDKTGSLFPKLPDLRGKRLILLLNELLQRGVFAVRKSIFNALHKQD